MSDKVFFIFFYLYLLSQIYGNLIFGFRRDKHEKCSTRRGLRVGTKKHSYQELKLLYAMRATRGYQNHGISSDFHVK